MNTQKDRETFDVAVVGGGPGGSTTARCLAQKGFRVILFEKEDPPRVKVCAGGVIPRVLRGLPGQAMKAVEKECFRAEIHIVDQNLHFTVTRDAPIVSTTMRDRFDFILMHAAEEAGVRVVSGCRVLDFSRKDGGLDVHTVRGTFSSRFVVGADGALSVVARKAGFADPGYLVPALESEVKVSSAGYRAYGAAVRFDFGIVPKGYGWVFPKKEHLSIGVGQMRKGNIHLGNILKRYLRYLGMEESQVFSKRGFVIPVKPRREGFVRDRCLLVGDAAGLVDPVTGEGISAAIESGRIAVAGLTNGGLKPGQVKSSYEKGLKVMLNELKWGRFVSYLAYDNPKIRSFLFRTCGQQVCEAMTDIIFGTKTYKLVFSHPLTYVKMFLSVRK